MVFTQEGWQLLIAEDGQTSNSAVGHKDTYKLFEECQSALEENAKQGVFRHIMGQVNGGKQSTIFIATCVERQNGVRYELRWLKNCHLNCTFEYSYAFVPQIFTLYVCFNLAEPEFKGVNIKKSLFKPAIRSKGKTSRVSDALCKYLN